MYSEKKLINFKILKQNGIEIVNKHKGFEIPCRYFRLIL